MAKSKQKMPVEFIIKPIINRMGTFGFYPKRFNILDRMWWYFLFISNITWIVLSCVHLKKMSTLEDISEVVLNMSCLTQVLASLLIFRIYRKTFLENLDIIQKHFWFQDIKVDDSILAKHQTYYRILSSIGSGYQGICYGCIGVWFMEPIIHNTGVFPMDMSFPQRNFIKEFPYYEITYFFQAVSVPIGAFLVVFLDILYIAGIGFILIQVDLIKQKLRNVISEEGNEKEIYEKLKEYIAHHNIVLTSLQKIEKTYKYSLLDKILCDILCLCVITYMFSEQQSLNLKFLLILAVSGSQPLLYCFFGDFVTSECASIGQEAYEVNWEEYGHNSFTSALSMMIMRSQKEVFMTAGGMMIFSLPNYVAYMKMMFSFYLVLKQKH